MKDKAKSTAKHGAGNSDRFVVLVVAGTVRDLMFRIRRSK